METQIQLDPTNHTLPPRKTVHKRETTRKRKSLKTKKWNSLQIFVWLFIFLIFGIAYGVYQYGLMKEESRWIPIRLPEHSTTTLSPQTPSKSSTSDEETVEKNISSEELEPNAIEQVTVQKGESQPEVELEGEAKVEAEVQPSTKIHVVQPGETMFRISLNYYKSGSYAAKLAQYNQIKSYTELHAGAKLKIPAKEVLDSN